MGMLTPLIVNPHAVRRHDGYGVRAVCDCVPPGHVLPGGVFGRNVGAPRRAGRRVVRPDQHREMAVGKWWQKRWQWR